MDDLAPIHVIDVHIVTGLRDFLAEAGAGESGNVVAAVSTNDEGHGVVLPRKAQRAREALVVVRVSGDDCMRIDASLFADGVDLGQHDWTAVVLAAARTAALRTISERRMVNREDDRSRIVAALDLLQLRGEEVELIVRNRRPLGPALRRFARDHAGIFEGIGKQTQDADKWRVEREVDAGLRHAGAVKRSGFLRDGD